MPAKRKKSANHKISRRQHRSPKINELLYKTLIENIHLGITLIDTNHRIVTTNVGQDKLFKKPKNELIGKFCFKEFEKRSAICPHCPGTKTMATGRPAEAYAEGTRDDGSHIQARLRTFPVFDPDGSVSGFIEIVENITEYKRTEESLRESEERFKAIFNNAADGILLADVKTRKFYMANKVICQMLGYTLEEIKNLKAPDIHPKKSLPYTMRQFERQAAKELAVAENMPVRRKDGSVFYADINAFPIVLDGKTYLAGIFRDVTERRQAEEKLKESEQRFKAIIDNAPDGILLAEVESKKFYMGNKVMCRMLGCESEEIKNKTVSNIHRKEHLPYVMEQFERLARKEIMVAEDIPVKSKDGSVFFADISAFTITFGGKTYIGGIFRDITERKKAREELHRAEAKYRTLVEQIPAVTYTAAIDKASTTTYVSPQIQQFLGFSQQHYKVDHDLWLKHLHPDDRQRVLESLYKTQSGGQPFNCEYRMFNKDGNVVWFRDEAVVVRDSSDRPVMLQGVMFDITAQKQTEEELYESEERFRSLAETTSDWIWEVDKNGIYTYVSPKVKDLLGYEPDEVVGKTPFDLMVPNEMKNVREKFRAIIESQRPFTGLENTNLHKNGRYVVLETSGVPIFGPSGNLSGYRGIDRDITERRKAEEELNTYREKMAQTERLASLGTLSATVAHELTQPLTVIRLSIENSLEDLEPTSCCKAVKDVLKDALNEVINATSVVDRFRNYARQSSKKNLCKTNLNAVADRIIRLLSKTAKSAKINLNLKGLDKLPPVYSNEKDLEQLFFALIENAIHAADGKKNNRLTIDGVAKGGNVELRFADNCCGVAPENLGKIFDPFFTTGSEDGRTGLGLPIVQKILSEHGGKISVRSRQGKGTTFYVTLPIHSETTK